MRLGFHIVAAVSLLAAGQVHAANFATCVLDKMPGVQNAATSMAVMQTCRSEHPSWYSGVEKGSGRGIFSFSDGNACIIKKAASTPFQPAATAIAIACRCLYDKASQDGQMCDGTIRFPDGSTFDPSTAVPVN